MKNKKLYHKINHVKIGFMTGLILPILGFFIGFLAKGGDLFISSFWQLFTQKYDLVSILGFECFYPYQLFGKYLPKIMN